MPESSILSFDTNMLGTLVVQWVNLLVLVAALYFLLYKPVRRFLQKREERLRTLREDAEQEQRHARELREKYEELIENIEGERDEILEAGREAALGRSEEIIAEARRDAANIYRRSMEDLRMEQENQMDEMRSAIVEISTQMASRFVTVSMDRETQDRFIDEALEHLEEKLWEE